MTLIAVCYTPAGIAISADSRTTAMRVHRTVPQEAPAGAPTVTVRVPWVISDSTNKLFCVQDRYAVGTWGDGFINDLPTAHHVDDFLRETQPAATTEALADALLAHFTALSPSADLHIAVAGYDGAEPFVFEVEVAANTKKRCNAGTGKSVSYGIFYGGDTGIVERLMRDEIEAAWQVMNLQDAVDMSRHLVRTTIDQMRFETEVPTVGGTVETVTLTQAGARFLIRNELRV